MDQSTFADYTWWWIDNVAKEMLPRNDIVTEVEGCLRAIDLIVTRLDPP